MSIRIKQQGGIYTVIRSTYVKAESRGVDATIGSFSIEEPAIPARIIEKLEGDEPARLAEKFSNLLSKKRVEKNFERLGTAAADIHSMASALRNFARFRSAEEAEKVFAAIADLKVSMREAGYKQKRAKPAAKPAAEPDAAQTTATKAAGAAAGLGAKKLERKASF